MSNESKCWWRQNDPDRSATLVPAIQHEWGVDIEPTFVPESSLTHDDEVSALEIALAEQMFGSSDEYSPLPCARTPAVRKRPDPTGCSRRQAK